MDSFNNHVVLETKPWGFEKLFGLTKNYAGKILFIKAGESLSLQHHLNKEETIYVFSGHLLLNFGNTPEEALLNSMILEPGDSFHVPPGLVHRFAAKEEDVTLFEVSTPELTDIIRHEDRYGRK